ncbi:DUF4139 domain-containing protein [candidate division KSB1 bacterium]|nr:DUF4139 domain-containing protein [candidate division KSB1 bacterium]
MKGIFNIFIIASLFIATSGTVWSQNSEMTLTVYNDDLALIKDVRIMALENGVRSVKFSDVAAQIDPTSVHIKSLTAPEKVSVLEQNYEFDLVDVDKLMQKYIDQEIKAYTKEKVYAGTLLSAGQSDIMLKEGSGNIRVINRRTILDVEFPSLPEGLITRPTLVWLVQSQKSGDHRMELSYLTSGINWHAEYVAVSKQNDTRLEISGWVSIDNRSGASYEDAKLKLVAGDIHRVKPPTPRISAETAFLAKATAAPQFEEKSFFEYHMYTLQRRATVRNNQIKQISLIPSTQCTAKKVYIYDGGRDNKNVRVNLEFINSKKDGLGLPLPKGKIRVYKEDDDDHSLEFIGEDAIDHTPRDEKIRVFVGNAFDIVGERKQQDYKKLGKEAREETWQIQLRNHKDEAVNVTVVEHVYGDWEIRRKTHNIARQDANTIEFEVPVAKDAEAVLEYVILYRW